MGSFLPPHGRPTLPGAGTAALVGGGVLSSQGGLWMHVSLHLHALPTRTPIRCPGLKSLARMKRAKWYSPLDLEGGYWQVDPAAL